MSSLRCKKQISGNSIHINSRKENIKETREAITPIVDTVKLPAAKYFIERSQGQSKNDLELGKSNLTNFGNLVELL